MSIRKIDKNIGTIPNWGDDDFDENVHENFTDLKTIIPAINNTIDDINALLATIQAVNALGGVGLVNLSNEDILEWDSALSKFKNTNLHSKTAKTTIEDEDEVAVASRVDEFGLKKITFLNIKKTLKTYFQAFFVNRLASTVNNTIYKADGTSGSMKATGVIIDDNNSLIVPYIKIDNGSTSSYVGISLRNSNPAGGFSFLDAQGLNNVTDSSIMFQHFPDNSSQIIFATQLPGTNMDRRINRMRIDSAGNMFVPAIYNNTTASASNLFIDSVGKFFRSTSSKQYKTNIETIDKLYVDKFFNNARPIYYKSLSENDNPNWGYWGFIAEDIAEFDRRLVHWRYQTKDVEVEKERFFPAIKEIRNEKDEIIQEAVEERIEKYIEIEQVKDESKPLVAEGVMYERVTVLQTAKIQEQQKIIESLIARVEKLEALV